MGFDFPEQVHSNNTVIKELYDYEQEDSKLRGWYFDKFGFNTSGALATASALFFIVLLAHIEVRQQFFDSPLVYIEYFYLIMYLAILLCALNAYAFSISEKKRFNLVMYRDNPIPKLAFWPLLLSMMALATVFFL